MSVFVLVHGGFYGGWGFTKVANIMRASGHEVFTPTLTGQGERAHLASPDIGFHTNVQDIVGVLQCEDLHKVILVGHSYGSAVIFGVAEKEADRIARLVVLDGWIPKDGQTVFELMGHELTKQWLDYAKEKGEGWRGPGLPNPPFSPPRWQPPIVTGGNESIEIKNPVAQKIPRAFIRCATRDKNSVVASGLDIVDRYADEAKQNGWWYRDIPAIHGVMLSNPQLLVDTLLELA